MKKLIVKVGVIVLGGITGFILIFCSVYLIKNYPRSASPFEIV